MNKTPPIPTSGAQLTPHERPPTDYLTHILICLGVLLFALPVWLVFAGSTQDSAAITRGELSSSRICRPLRLLARPDTGTMGTQPVWHMLLVSLGMALSIAFGKIVISCCPPTPWCSSASRSAAPRSG